MWPSRWMLSSLFALLTLAPAVGRAAVPLLQQPQAYAVVIGISQYREEAIPKVPYAVKDAEAIAQMLERQAGIPKTHIRLLTDAKATGNDLRTVEDWLKLRVKSESTVYVYYAGHGTPNPKTGEAYLVPWDGNPDYPAGLFPLNDLYAALNKLPAKDVVVLLDACFSGAQGRSVLAKGARPMVISVENPLLASGKVIVLAASTGNQISSDYDKAGHGLFTHAVLTGLHGAADKDKNGLVTLKELYPYVRERVATTAVDELNREQTPVLLPGEEALGVRSAMPVALALPGGTEAPKPSTTLSQAERELKALEEQERQVAEQQRLAEIQAQIEEKKKKIEVVRARPYEAPNQSKSDQPTGAIINTKFGQMEIKFFSDRAPVHVANFSKLAREGFYNGTIFHRVIPGFMIQGGDPNTKDHRKKDIYGQGGPGYFIKAEFNDTPHKRGIVSMARASEPNSAGSQFFIVVEDSRFLDGKYTVFGEIVKGMDVADRIVNQPRDSVDNPTSRTEMTIQLID